MGRRPAPPDGGARPSPLDLLLRALVIAAGLMVAFMMVLTFADVVGRYVFNRPIGGAFELTEVFMGLVIFAGLPLASAARENIAVTLVYDRFPAPVRRWLLLVLDLVAAGVLGVLAWRMWLHGERLLRVRETTLELGIPMGAVACAMAAMLALAALVFLAHAWRGLRPGGAGP